MQPLKTKNGRTAPKRTQPKREQWKIKRAERIAAEKKTKRLESLVGKAGGITTHEKWNGNESNDNVCFGHRYRVGDGRDRNPAPTEYDNEFIDDSYAEEDAEYDPDESNDESDESNDESDESNDKSEEESTDIYKVAGIIAHRFGLTGFEFLVSWEGYSVLESTWEPFENIIDKSLVTRYFASQVCL